MAAPAAGSAYGVPAPIAERAAAAFVAFITARPVSVAPWRVSTVGADPPVMVTGLPAASNAASSATFWLSNGSSLVTNLTCLAVIT